MKILAIAFIFFIIGGTIGYLLSEEANRRKKKMIVTRKGQLKEIETE